MKITPLLTCTLYYEVYWACLWPWKLQIYILHHREGPQKGNPLFTLVDLFYGVCGLIRPLMCKAASYSLSNPTHNLFQIMIFCLEIYVLTFKRGIYLVLMLFWRLSHSSLFGMDQQRQLRPVLTVTSLWNGDTTEGRDLHWCLTVICAEKSTSNSGLLGRFWGPVTDGVLRINLPTFWLCWILIKQLIWEIC